MGVHPGRTILMLASWVAYLKVFHISPFVGKSPTEVVRYFTRERIHRQPPRVGACTLCGR